MPLTVFSPVKVNLGISLGKLRPDGFHQLNSTLISLNTGDRLSFLPNSTEDNVTCSRTDVPGGENNLVFQALQLIRSKLHDIPLFNIYIDKKIPPGTGLGAGSSNAAISLMVLNDFSSQPLTIDQLQALSAGLGSDVPFFIRGGFAEVTGRGEEIHYSSEYLKGIVDYFRNKIFVLIIPNTISVSTKQAYQSFDLTDNSIQDTKNVFKLDNRNYGNDFESVVFKSHFQLKDYRDKLLQKGAEVAMLCGSGAALFGVFSQELQAELAAKSFKPDEVITILTRSRNSWKSWQDLVVN